MASVLGDAVMIDPALVSLHAYGSLVIALHDGRLLAVAISTPDCTVNAIQRRATDGSTAKRPVISWATGCAP